MRQNKRSSLKLPHREIRLLRKVQLPCTSRVAFLVGALLVAKMLLARQLVLGHVLGLGAFADVAAITAVVIASALAGRRLGRAMLASAAIVTSLALLAGVLYASYFAELPTLLALSMTRQLGPAGAGAGQLLNWVHILFVIDLPLLVWLALKSQPSWPPTRRLVAAGSVSVALAMVFAFTVTAMPKPMDALRTSYTYGFFAYEIGASFGSPMVPSASAEKGGKALADVVDDITGHAPNAPRRPSAPDPGSMRGKNLIVIQMEALQDGVIGARYRGQPIVPNLDRLARESLYFPNTYSQTGRGNTSDAEFVANTSLYPAMDQPSSVAYARKQIPSLPRLLRAAGYRTMTMHTNDVAFWNRFQLYSALGFDEVYDQAYFANKGQTSFGAHDDVLYERSLPLLTAGAGAPFYAHLITVSAHYPFTAAASRGTLNMPADVARTETGRYLQAQSYADAELGDFISRLAASGLLEESVVVIFGDHFGMRFEDQSKKDYALRKQLIGHYNRADYLNVPLLIRLPGGQGKREAGVVGQVDIMPTIVDLFGLDAKDLPQFGKSVFADSPTLLTRASSIPTYIDDRQVFLGGVTNGEDRWYSSITQEMLPPGKMPERMDDARRLVEMSQSYASGLPERPDASDVLGDVPESAARFEQTPFR